MKFWHVILILVLLASTFFLGRYTAVKFVEEVQTDTVVWYDTIVSVLPPVISEIEVGKIEIPVPVPVIRIERDTVIVRDTVYLNLNLPRIQREYLTDDYRAFVSGYDPRLDSIFVYQRNEVVYKYKEAKRWGFGVIGGYGYGNGGFSPYIGVGVYYRLF